MSEENAIEATIEQAVLLSHYIGVAHMCMRMEDEGAAEVTVYFRGNRIIIKLAQLKPLLAELFDMCELEFPPTDLTAPTKEQS